MAEFKIDGRMTVRKLKESFKTEFGGTLRVYNGRELADDAATLASIRKIDNVKVGDYICRASRTVGKFEEEMKEVFGIRVQVASPDDYILALDGITLANLKNIKEKATKADMEELVAYKRKEKNVVEGSEVDSDVCEEGVSEIDMPLFTGDILLGDQQLGHGVVVFSEELIIEVHQLALSHSGGCLLGRNIGGACF